MDQNGGVVWSIPVSERQKYDQIFDGLQPVNGLLTGDKVKPLHYVLLVFCTEFVCMVLLNSKLPVEVLGRVWELSDIDTDGFLDREEFTVAMHLVYRALEKNPVPTALPPEMIPPGKRKSPAGGLLPGAVMTPLVAARAPHQDLPSVGGSKWVVSPADKLKYDEMFKEADADGDGLVNGIQVKDVFLQTSLPQMTLAHIWNLCDTKMCGQLNADQFALAMHLVHQKRVHGIDPPAQLTPEMLPPSLHQDQPGPVGLGLTDTVDMKELDMLAAQIEQTKRDKMALEQEKAQKEADIRIRNGEVASLQKELDSMNSMVTQLGAQKEEAQKRLDELDAKRNKLENSVAEIKEKYNEEQRLIKEFQNQILNRESIVTNQEVELKRMKEELDRLRQEESELELRLDSSRHQSNSVAKRLADTQAEVNQTNKQIDELKELRQQLNESVKQYDDRLKGNITEDQLNQVPNMSSIELFTGSSQSDSGVFKSEPVRTLEASAAAVTSSSIGESFTGGLDPFSGPGDPFGNKAPSSFDTDPFNKKDPFGFDGTNESDPFGGDPFAEGSTGAAADSKSFMVPPSETFSIGQDPWNAPKAATLGTAQGGFDAFGFSSSAPSDKVDQDLLNSLDPFGTGSFEGGSHAAGSSDASGFTFKSHSPVVSSTPMLPPKQKKAPAPPRPPAPKPARTDSPSYRGESPQQPSQPEFYSTRTKFSSEAEQIAWATLDSRKEFERQKRLQEQEQADLELAIALSKQ